MTAPLPPGALVVFALIGVALVLFVTEPIPTDMTAIGVIVTLVVLEPLTGISAPDALSGFSSPATITIVAMYMLSAGVQRTGVVHRLGDYLARVTGGREGRVLAATIGTTGPLAGIINNTPVVAVLIPVITDLADTSHISRSKLLLPLSFAAMLGGTLTLIGTATNILASDLSRQLLGRPISMFAFTKLGVIVLLVGSAYLLTIGRRLTPERVPPAADLTAEFDLGDHLTQIVVSDASPIVGDRVRDVFRGDTGDPDLAILQIARGDEAYHGPDTDRVIEPGDVLTVRASLQAVNRFATRHGLRPLHREEVTAETLRAAEEGVPIEVVVPADSAFAGRTVAESKFEERYGTTVLGVRRGTDAIRTGIPDVTLEAGDTLLIQTTRDAVDFFTETTDLVVTRAPTLQDDSRSQLDPRTPIALGIMAVVIAIAAAGVVPIVIAALGGVVAMIVTGTLSASEAYDAVSWNVVFLLAGVIPLGLAMQATGGAAYLADVLVGTAAILPLIAVLGLFYLLTGLLANVITPVASVVLMIPIAVDTAARIGGNEYAFLLAVMFAGSTAFMTPVGYQTNLMVYGPGGYRFSDFVRVGAPLQLLLMVVTTLGIAAFWGVTP